MIFVTVGTYPLQFDRLLKELDRLAERGLFKDEVFAQIGHSTYTPRNFKSVDVLDKVEFDSILSKSKYIISHAGMGSISMALDHGIPILVVPRQKKFGEIVNDHQVDTAERFQSLGHVLAAIEVSQIESVLESFWTFKPVPRISEAASIVKRINQFIDTLGQ